MIDVNISKKVVVPFSDNWIRKVIELVSEKERKIRGELEVIIVGDKEIKRINNNSRGKDSITDVLSFAWQEDVVVNSNVLGEVYICYPQIKRQSKIWEVSEREEFARMLIHGLLHLVGYDHDSEKKSKKMFDLQEKILKML